MVPARLNYFPTECMSIAVSAVVRTPVCVRLLQACLGLCALAAAWPLSGNWSGASAPGHLGAYAWPLPLAAISAAGGLLLLVLCCRPANACRLDISPVGQLRLAVYLNLNALNVTALNSTALASMAPQWPPPVWRLLPGSTLWPALLVLQLANDKGARRSVLLQRGTHGCAAFRAVAVACRVMAARERQGGDKK